jgi:hypothetical protein
MTALLSLLIAFLAMGLALRRGWRPLACFSLGTVVLFGGFTADLLLPGTVGGPTGFTIWRREFDTSLEATLALYRQWGWEEPVLQRTGRLIRFLFGDAIFGWLAVAAAATAGPAFALLRRAVRGPDGERVAVRPFTAWVVPDALGWVLIAALGLLIAGLRLPGPYAPVAWNLLVVLGAWYFLGGLTVAAFLLERQKVPRVLQVMMLLAVAFLPLLVLLLALVGLFDTWGDWRRLRKLAS